MDNPLSGALVQERKSVLKLTDKVYWEPALEDDEKNIERVAFRVLVNDNEVGNILYDQYENRFFRLEPKNRNGDMERKGKSAKLEDATLKLLEWRYPDEYAFAAGEA